MPCHVFCLLSVIYIQTFPFYLISSYHYLATVFSTRHYQCLKLYHIRIFKIIKEVLFHVLVYCFQREEISSYKMLIHEHSKLGINKIFEPKELFLCQTNTTISLKSAISKISMLFRNISED